MASQPNLKAIRRNNDGHQIEDVGAKLRAMMPWIAKNKLVNKGGNNSSPAAEEKQDPR